MINAAKYAMARSFPARYQGLEGDVSQAFSLHADVVNFHPMDKEQWACLLPRDMPGLQVDFEDAGLPANAGDVVNGPGLLLAHLGAKACASCPDEASRIARGAAIVEEQRLLLHGDRTATVLSSDGSRAYTVTCTSCSCPDSSKGGYRCKHRWARTLAFRLATRLRHTWYGVLDGAQGIAIGWRDAQDIERVTWVTDGDIAGKTTTRVPEGLRLGGHIFLQGLQRAWMKTVAA